MYDIFNLYQFFIPSAVGLNMFVSWLRPGQVVSASNASFGDPCYGIRKKLFVCWKMGGVEAVPEVVVTSASDLLETIRGFAQLKLEGLLTDEEFTAAKRLALGEYFFLLKYLQCFMN